MMISGLSAGCIESAQDLVSGDVLGSVGVKSVNFEHPHLVVDFDPEFDEYDGWVLHHEYEDPSEEHFVFRGQYPRFGGPIEFPFIEETKETDYPTKTFAITAFKGKFSDWDNQINSTIIKEQGPTAEFDVPERALQDVERTSDGGTPGEDSNETERIQV